METKNIKRKLNDARKLILESKIEKKGLNAFSKYKYFTPSQITSLVNDACIKNDITTAFKIENTESGYIARLHVLDIDSESKIEFSMPVIMPELKGANDMQKIGGMVTYSERYLKMIAFAISDDSLDIDEKPLEEKKETLSDARFKKALPLEEKKETLSDARFKKALEAVKAGKFSMESLKNDYSLTEKQLEQCN